MLEFLMSILTWVIDFFMGLFGFKKEKQVSFNEVAETSTGEVKPILPPAPDVSLPEQSEE